uniref:Sec20 n=2 Tax=Schistocephalus solidus TaxID=70667 RepID=A0A0X3P0J7_SCHSO
MQCNSPSLRNQSLQISMPLFLQNAYRETVYSAVRKLEAAERKQLISGASSTINTTEDAKIRNQVLSSLKLTDEMRIHARRLAEEVARGVANAELVDDSSGQFSSNLKSLKDMGGHLQMAGRLGHKLSRRRIADCVLFTLVFLFFYLTCAYIILKRLYFFKLL